MGSTPFIGPPPSDIPLQNTPLIRVIAQIRFSRLLSLEGQDFAALYQKLIKDDFPILEKEDQYNFQLHADKQPTYETTTIWRFFDATKQWQVSLSSSFIALETKSYQSREDFVRRLHRLLQVFESLEKPHKIQRIGVRYIDHLKDVSIDEFRELVRPEIGGMYTSDISSHVRTSQSEHVYSIEEERATLVLRWGLLPKGTEIRSQARTKVLTDGWVLDFDAYRDFEAEMQPFDAQQIVENVEAYAKRIYSVFRWTVTDAFLRRYGEER